ncbi:SpoIIE family protein phosphatase [Bacteroidota bacterium]
MANSYNTKRIIHKSISILLLVFLLINLSFSNTRADLFNIDSLLEVAEYSNDTSKLIIYKDIAWFIRNTDPIKSLKYGNKALEISMEIKDSNQISTLHNYIGVFYSKMEMWPYSLESYLIAFEIAKKIGNKVEIGYALNNISQAYKIMGNDSLAFEFSLKALNFFEEANDEVGKAYCYSNIANQLIEKNQYDDALNYLVPSLKILYENEKSSRLTFCYCQIGKIYQEKEELHKAIENFKKALEIAQKDQNELGIGVTLIHIGNIHVDFENYAIAKKYYNDALVIANQIGSLEIINNAYSGLSSVYFKLGDFKRAFDQLKLYNQSNDSLKTIQNSNKINQLVLQNKFDKELQEKETEQQNRDIEAQANLQRQKAIRNYTLVVLSLFVFLGFIIIRNSHKIKNANTQLLVLNDHIREQKEEIESQRDLVIYQKREITDSIVYAKRIQSAILPPETYITELLHENFIFYKPRDIVSGDFYWIKQVNHYIILIAADCTGHGVPGAFMSMLGISYLNEIVQRREITQANQVLNELRSQIKHSLRQHGQRDESKDGMDIALCILDTKNNMMQYAGAYNPLYLFRDVNGEPELKEIKADRMPVGFFHGKDKSFTNHEIQLEMGDTLYIFSDGFMDQIGGKGDKKYMSKNFKNLLLGIHEQPMYKQKEILDKTLTDWMGEFPQLDDILIIGVRV